MTGARSPPGRGAPAARSTTLRRIRRLMRNAWASRGIPDTAKAALFAGALDQRWAIVFPSCSGEGGAKPSRRNYGQTLDNIAGSHWMALNFHKYAGHWGDLPVDSE